MLAIVLSTMAVWADPVCLRQTRSAQELAGTVGLGAVTPTALAAVAGTWVLAPHKRNVEVAPNSHPRP